MQPSADSIFQAARERSEHERSAFVDGACAGDVGFAKVEALIAADTDAGTLLSNDVVVTAMPGR